MASEVDISNLALAHLGDTATVTNLAPPDGSAQATHCARFYPMARDAALEMHHWAFATTRASLAQLATNPTSSWKYAYAAPSNVVNFIAVLDPQAADDYSVGIQMAGTGANSITPVGVGIYTPQPFDVETNDSGAQVLLSNVQNAVLRYTRLVSDTTLFTPLFVQTVAHLLASMLAGPLLKGDVGREVSNQHYKLALDLLARAAGSDANQRSIKPAPGAAWMVNR